MRITIDSSVIEAADNNEGAFIRAFQDEMRGAVIQCWYDWLRGNVPAWQVADKAAIRAEATRLTDAGEMPPVADYSPPDDA